MLQTCTRSHAKDRLISAWRASPSHVSDEDGFYKLLPCGNCNHERERHYTTSLSRVQWLRALDCVVGSAFGETDHCMKETKGGYYIVSEVALDSFQPRWSCHSHSSLLVGGSGAKGVGAAVVTERMR